jgi:hypothetical protein
MSEVLDPPPSCNVLEDGLLDLIKIFEACYEIIFLLLTILLCSTDYEMSLEFSFDILLLIGCSPISLGTTLLSFVR